MKISKRYQYMMVDFKGFHHFCGLNGGWVGGRGRISCFTQCYVHFKPICFIVWHKSFPLFCNQFQKTHSTVWCYTLLFVFKCTAQLRGELTVVGVKVRRGWNSHYSTRRNENVTVAENKNKCACHKGKSKSYRYITLAGKLLFSGEETSRQTLGALRLSYTRLIPPGGIMKTRPCV